MSAFLQKCDDGKVRHYSVPALMRLLESGVRPEELVDFAAFDAADPHLFMRLSMIFHICGNVAMSLETQRDALKRSTLYRLAPPAPPALRLLAIAKPGYMKDNTPLEFLLEGSDVELQTLYLSDDLPAPAALPEHDLAFVAIAQSAQHLPLLERVRALLKDSGRPVLNLPPPGFTLERDQVCALLADIPGMLLPATRAVPREALARIAAADFPVIVRPYGSQAGLGLVKMEGPDDIAPYLDAWPDAAFYVAPFVDYSGSDGLYRKCRIALIGGQPHVCHLALSEHWIVHYHGAGMKRHAERRDEEARFMQASEQSFCARHRAALLAVGERLGLDYVVLDCAETADGRLLFFEADNIALVHAMDPVDLFPYKQAQMATVFAAFRAMLIARADAAQGARGAPHDTR